MKRYKKIVIVIIALFNFVICSKNSYCSDSLIKVIDKAVVAYQENNLIKSERLLNNALMIKSDNYDEIIRLYLNLSYVKFELRKFGDAIILLNKANEIIIENKKNNVINKIGLIINLGSIYLEMGDLNKAIEYFTESISLSEKAIELSRTEKYEWLEISYYNLGIAYYKKNQYLMAISFFNSQLNFLNKSSPEILIYTYNILAKSYYKIGNTGKADYYFNKSIKIVALKNFNHYYISEVYSDYADYLLETGQHKEAGENYSKSLFFAKQYYGEHTAKTSKALMNLANWFVAGNKYNTAINYYQQAFHALIPEFTDTTGYSNPANTDVNDKLLLVDILKNKANALNLLAGEQKNIKYNVTALEAYKLCSDALDKIKNSFLTTGSKLFITEKEKPTYILALNEAYNLFKETNNSNYLNDMLFYSEKIKSSVLLSAMRGNEALEFSGIPEKMLFKEQDLKREISVYEGMIYEESRMANTDTQQIKIWQEKIFTLKNEYDGLLKSFEDNYPAYFRLRYDNHVASINDVRRKIKPTDAIIEYALDDSLLFIMCITKDKTVVQKIKIDSCFYKSIEFITWGISNRAEGEGWGLMNFNDFKIHSYSLFKSLIGPVYGLIKGKELLIIPDERLAGLPFDILLSEKPQEKKKYSGLPYLIYDFPVSYAYSLTLFTNEKKHLENNNKTIAFAPSYSKTNNIIGQVRSIRQQYDQILVPIPGAHDEVTGLSGYVKGDTLFGDDASESVFKNKAGGYMIIHLAAHTIIDDEKPLYSKIAFDADTSGEDNFLNTYELYNLDLNAELAFLSSCRSGSGKVFEGEGIMSLARGFTYAGCNSIIFTLWEIDDFWSSKVVIDFYKYLSKGYPKNRALQKAKINFIKNADVLHSHPYYWSGFVLTGDKTALFISVYIKAGILVLVLAVIVFAIIAWSRKVSYTRHRR